MLVHETTGEELECQQDFFTWIGHQVVLLLKVASEYMVVMAAGKKSNCKASMATFLREVLGGVIHRQRIVGQWKKEYPHEKDYMWA